MSHDVRNCVRQALMRPQLLSLMSSANNRQPQLRTEALWRR